MKTSDRYTWSEYERAEARWQRWKRVEWFVERGVLLGLLLYLAYLLIAGALD